MFITELSIISPAFKGELSFNVALELAIVNPVISVIITSGNEPSSGSLIAVPFQVLAAGSVKSKSISATVDDHVICLVKSLPVGGWLPADCVIVNVVVFIELS